MKKAFQKTSAYFLILPLSMLSVLAGNMETETIIDGKWTLIKSVASGIGGASPKNSFLIIKGTVFERHIPDYVFTRTMILNNKTLPKQVDLLITNEPDKGKTFLGIYKLEGDTLYIAHSLSGKPRPADFESTIANKQILSVSVKEKTIK